MIEGVQTENLEYETFCSIFEKDKENNEGRLASAATERSMISQGSAK
jgi:hypothetical protein